MSEPKSLFDFPVHLGRGGTAVSEPEFSGKDWYPAYGLRHQDDLDEGRLVSLFRFEENWSSWEMHPNGDELVCVVQGHITLHQEFGDSAKRSLKLGPSDYAINPRGVWHTADCDEPVVALFITPGAGTTNRPR